MKFIDKFSKFFSLLYTHGLTFLGFGIILVLTIFNMINTCFLNSGEYVFQTKDSFIINIFIIVLFTVFLSSLWDNKKVQLFLVRIENDEILLKKIFKILLFIIFGVSMFWILITQVKPGADQEFIQNAVLAVKNKDYSDFQLGGYMSKYPNQIGFFCISYVFSLIFGDYNFICIQIINAIAVTFTYKIFADILNTLNFKKIHQLAIAFLGILFLPFIFYSTFIYGTVLGVLFSLIAIKHEILYFKDFHLKDAFISAITIAFSIMLKNNFLIVFIAIILYALVEIIVQKLWTRSWFLLLLISSFLFQSIVPTMVVEKITESSLDSGINSWSWIAMGLQDGPLCSGWYNGYNEISYQTSQLDPEKQATIAKYAIKESLDQFKSDKAYARKFFSDKITSIWSEPTFESIWITQIRPTSIEHSSIAWRLLQPGGHYPLIVFLNYLQVCILFGTLLYFVLCRKEKYYRQSLILIMTFIGGFLFHLAWEAKGQYSITYFILLLPYAAVGYTKILEILNKLFTIPAIATTTDVTSIDNNDAPANDKANKNANTQANNNNSSANTFCKLASKLSIPDYSLIALSAIILLYFGILTINNAFQAYDVTTKEFNTYIQNEKYKIRVNVKDGKYILRNADFEEAALDYSQEGQPTSPILLSSGSSKIISVSTRLGISKIKFEGTNLYLDEYNSENKEHEYVEAREKSNSIGQEWTIIPAGGDSFYITHYNDYALTYDTETGEIYVTTNTHASNQRWYFQSVD